MSLPTNQNQGESNNILRSRISAQSNALQMFPVIIAEEPYVFISETISVNQKLSEKISNLNEAKVVIARRSESRRIEHYFGAYRISAQSDALQNVATTYL